MSVLDLQADEDVSTGTHVWTETSDSRAQLRVTLEDAFAISGDMDDVVAMSGYAWATHPFGSRWLEFDEQ